MAERTLVQMLEKSAEKYGDNILMWEKKTDAFEGTTYKQIRDSVHTFAAGLLALGVNKGDRLALISEGRNAWVIAELGILYAGAINVPMSVKIDELSDLKFRLSHSGCRMAVVSKSQLAKVLAVKNDLPDMEKIIVFDKPDEENGDLVVMDKLMQMGTEFMAGNREAFDERWQSAKEDDVVNICYTSGTTADPKGIMLTHRNYTANVEQASSILPIYEWYTSLLILPWDHSFAHTAGIYTLMNNGASMSSVQIGATAMETLKNIPVNIKETKPVFLLSVPALAQNFRKNIEKGIRAKGPKVEKLFQNALKLAYKYNGIGWDRGKGFKFLLKPLYAVYDKILFSKIREGFGGRLEFFIGGGALLDIELQRFFYAVGMPMYQGYGLTEAAPIISANVPMKHKLGSSGYVVPNLELKICDDTGNALPVGEKGEIVVKGENVMAGYWNNEKTTAETLHDGWLHTGDLGYVDKDNFLYVLGREKSLLISNDGEKYSPEGIEEALTAQSDYIDQVMLYNNQSAYTVALIVLNQGSLERALSEKGLAFDSEEGQNAVIKLIDDEINEYRKGSYAGMFPTKWLPATFAILGEGFTEQNKFLNTTLKMVRGRITEFYKARLDYMFEPEGKDIYNHQNKTIVSRFKN